MDEKLKEYLDAMAETLNNNMAAKIDAIKSELIKPVELQPPVIVPPPQDPITASSKIEDMEFYL